MAIAAAPTHTPRRPVVDTIGAAEYLGLHPRTMDNWRSQRRGPRYVRLGQGGRIVYRIADLEAYLDAQTVEVAG